MPTVKEYNLRDAFVQCASTSQNDSELVQHQHRLSGMHLEFDQCNFNHCEFLHIVGLPFEKTPLENLAEKNWLDILKGLSCNLVILTLRFPHSNDISVDCIDITFKLFV